MGFWHGDARRDAPAVVPEVVEHRDPDRVLNLDAFEASIGRPLGAPVSLADFVDYGHWFREQADISVDPRIVTSLERNGNGFKVTLSDSETFDATSVVVAVGIRSFAWRPPIFERLDPKLVSHTSEQRDFSRFRDGAYWWSVPARARSRPPSSSTTAGASTELVGQATRASLSAW